MDERERIIKRVEKLLALGQSDNANEAAAAIAHAQRLIERHAIAESELGQGGGEQPHIDHEPLYVRTMGEEPVHAWVSILAAAVAQATGCYVYERHRPSRHMIETRLSGCDSDVAMCRTLFVWCHSELLRLAESHAEGRHAGYLRSLLIGAVMRVHEEIDRERDRTREELKAEVSERSLMVIDTRAHAAQSILGDIPLGQEIDTNSIDSLAYTRGYFAAEGVYERARRKRIE